MPGLDFSWRSDYGQANVVSCPGSEGIFSSNLTGSSPPRLIPPSPVNSELAWFVNAVVLVQSAVTFGMVAIAFFNSPVVTPTSLLALVIVSKLRHSGFVKFSNKLE